MSRRPKYHCQPRIPGMRREQMGACVRKEIRDKIREIADRYGVRPSWVGHELWAHALGMKIDYSYKEVRDRR